MFTPLRLNEKWLLISWFESDFPENLVKMLLISKKENHRMLMQTRITISLQKKKKSFLHRNP